MIFIDKVTHHLVRIDAPQHEAPVLAAGTRYKNDEFKIKKSHFPWTFHIQKWMDHSTTHSMSPYKRLK